MIDKSLQAEWFEVCGSAQMARVQKKLEAAGYKLVYTPLTEPGQFTYRNSDAAPGWADWMFEVHLIELPDHPLSALQESWR